MMMFRIFNQPFPNDSSWHKKVLTGLSFGIFVFLFLWFFKPFGISMMVPGNPTAVFMGYGLVTAFILIFHGLFFPKIFPKYFEEKNWTVLKEILQTLFVIFLIGIGNTLYTHWLDEISLTPGAFITFQFFTLVIAILPVTLLILFKQIRLLKKNLEEAKAISKTMVHEIPAEKKDHNQKILLVSDNEKEEFECDSDQLLYLVAADNYIEIVYVDGKETKRKLLRSTLKKAQIQLNDIPRFFRCHRTYLVNLSRVIEVTGNAQGYKLILENTTEQIPVSRNLNAEIAQKLAAHNGK